MKVIPNKPKAPTSKSAQAKTKAPTSLAIRRSDSTGSEEACCRRVSVAKKAGDDLKSTAPLEVAKTPFSD